MSLALENQHFNKVHSFLLSTTPLYTECHLTKQSFKSHFILLHLDSRQLQGQTFFLMIFLLI